MVNRRDLLATIAGSGLTLAVGCLGSEDSNNTDSGTENGDDDADDDNSSNDDQSPSTDATDLSEDEPDPVAPVSCEQPDDGERLNGLYEEDEEVHYNKAGAFVLEANDETYEYGDTAKFSLTNTSSEASSTGNSIRHGLEVYTEDGWEDVRVWISDDFFGYFDDLISYPPDSGTEWTYELSDQGIADRFDGDVEICPPLQSGRYRFIFWGYRSSSSLAVEFDFIRDE